MADPAENPSRLSTLSRGINENVYHNGLTYAISLFVLGCVIIIAYLWIHFGDNSEFKILPQSSLDDTQKTLIKSIESNLGDFNIWSKLNITLQAVTVGAGILSTIFAAIATGDAKIKTRSAVVVLTAVTAACVTIQSTFHLRENLDIFIKANSDLEASLLQYGKTRDTAKSADKLISAQLALEEAASEGAVRVNETRMRAYSAIGAQQARGESSDLTRDDKKKSVETPVETNVIPVTAPGHAGNAGTTSAVAANAGGGLRLKKGKHKKRLTATDANGDIHLEIGGASTRDGERVEPARA